jgi:hypothetical protein
MIKLVQTTKCAGDGGSNIIFFPNMGGLQKNIATTLKLFEPKDCSLEQLNHASIMRYVLTEIPAISSS